MNFERYEKGYTNMKLVVKEDDYMFAPVETYDKAYTIAKTEKASSYMKQTIREKDDYTLAPNQVFNHVETKNKEFGNAEVFKGYSNMRQTEDNMFEQNKFLDEYAEVAKGYSNMRLTEDNMLQQNRFLGKYAEVAKDYSNMRQNEDNMFSQNRFLGEYETNNKVFAGSVQNVKGYETNDKVYATAQIVAKIPVSVSQTVSYGPWGGSGGVQFNDGSYTGVREIHLARTGGLVSIKVCYDLNGQAIWGNKNGRNGGLTVEKIRFEYPNEVLTHISGYYGSVILRGPTIIKSITFHTNKKKYGPFGDEQGIPFSSASKDGIIVGFHGRKGWFVDSIGVHVLEGKLSQPRPLSEQVVSGPVQGPGPYGQGDLTVGIVKKPASYGPVGLPAGMVKEPAPYGPVSLPAGMVKEPAPCGLGPWGGDGGQPWDDKVFTGIKKIFLTKGEAIYSIQMEYDCNGQSIWSVKHGCGNEGTPHLIQFEYPHEFLTCISGYYGSAAGDECRKVIKSLTFYTNRRRYGPYGEETGTYFTSTKDGGKIIGFHGRSSSFLYAIGVHIQPSLSDRVCREPKGCPPQYQFNFYQ